MQGMKRPQYTLRYLLLDTALWGLLFGWQASRYQVASFFTGSMHLPSLVVGAIWCALAGAAAGGIIGRMRVGAMIGVGVLVILAFTLG